MIFPTFTASTTSFDCSFEKQLLASIQNEKEMRANAALEREERARLREQDQASRPRASTTPSPNGRPQESPLQQVSLSSLQPYPPQRSLYPQLPSSPVQSSVKDEVFLELVNENFEPECIQRGFVLFPITDKSKLLDAVKTFAGLRSSGVPEPQIIEAYTILNGDISLVPKFIQSFQKLKEFGFPDNKIKEALFHCIGDYEASARYLVEEHS